MHNITDTDKSTEKIYKKECGSIMSVPTCIATPEFFRSTTARARDVSAAVESP